ncbi:L-rhamnose/proton symporter RhaT [Rubrivirga sp.]|uniref:L-rhamnose/proton symporter RhaT n=1 Tax=Rubrivirga sp. TaxID=1885344 RepID=UPI003B52AC03
MAAALGILLHGIGGFAAGSFYLPIQRIKDWAWESSWLVNGLAAWLVVPWVVGLLTVPDVGGVLASAPPRALFWCFAFGVLWGVGSLTFGMAMRYLGISLGMAVALGFTAAFGTLVPPIYEGTFGDLLQTGSGLITLAGVALCLVGIAVVGRAGRMKEGDLTDEQKTAVVEEFDLKKGVTVAVVAGVLSACFAFGLAAGAPIAEAAIAAGTAPLYQNNAVLIAVLAGGLTTNGLACLWMGWRNRTFGDYRDDDARLARNYGLAALAGLTWYLQFFFYGMGTTFLGEQYEFASWSIHMAFIILFSNAIGVGQGEWRGAGRSTMRTLGLGLVVLLGSVVLIGLASQIAGG